VCPKYQQFWQAMAKLKMNRRVPNKNTDLLKKISLMGTEQAFQCPLSMEYQVQIEM